MATEITVHVCVCVTPEWYKSQAVCDLGLYAQLHDEG